MQRIEAHYILLGTYTFKTASFLMGLQVVKVPASIEFENVLVTDDRQTDGQKQTLHPLHVCMRGNNPIEGVQSWEK